MTTEQIQEIPQPIQPVQQVPVEPKKKLSLSTIVILLVAIVLIGVGGIYAVKRLSQPKACTLEVKLCPDGSSVGRTGPNCEFAPCPTKISSATPTPDETANWKTCMNLSQNFTIKYPQDYDFDSATCNYALMDFNSVSNIDVVNPTEDLRKNWLLTITANNSDLNINQWIQSKICTRAPRCSNIIPGGLNNSAEVDFLDVHYAETDTVVKFNNTIFVFALNARNPNSQLSNEVRNVYNQILSTFKFLDQKETKYTCPRNGWVDCMPILDEEKKIACSKEAEEWYKTNCSDFKGFAQ